MSTRPPSADWSTDFDHLDPRWAEDPYPIWDELRQKCPIAHTERFQGAYFPSRYEDVRTIAAPGRARGASAAHSGAADHLRPA
jgi:cytochrome P450